MELIEVSLGKHIISIPYNKKDTVEDLKIKLQKEINKLNIPIKVV